jgi:hypothetical protein
MSVGRGNIGGGGGGDNASYGNNDENYDEEYHHNDHHGDVNSCWGCCCWWYIVLLSGLLCSTGLGVGIAFSTISIMKESSWVSVTGTIIGDSFCSCRENKNIYGSGCINQYAAFVEYVADDGLTYTFTDNVCGDGKPTIGKEIRVLYDPDSPGEGVTGGFFGLWLFPTIGFSIFAMFCCLLSAVATKQYDDLIPIPAGVSNTV